MEIKDKDFMIRILSELEEDWKNNIVNSLMVHITASKFIVELARGTDSLDAPLLLLGTGPKILLETYFINGLKPKKIYIVDPIVKEEYITSNIGKINRDLRYLDKMGLTKEEWKKLRIKVSTDPMEYRVPKHLLSIAIHPGFSMSPIEHSRIYGEPIYISWDQTIDSTRPSAIIFTSYDIDEFNDDCVFLRGHDYFTSKLDVPKLPYLETKDDIDFERVFGIAVDFNLKE